LTLCGYRPQLRNLTLKLTLQQLENPAPKRKNAVAYDTWLRDALPLCSGSDQSKPWVKELIKRLNLRRVLSKESL
jgi:hypothetical protein